MSELENQIQCQLCGKLLQTKEKFLDHLNRHLDYRKYPCNTCKKKFFSEREREEHCEKELHDHVFNTETKPYCEMILAVIQKDQELLKIYDSEVVIAGRRKSNAEFEKKVNERQLKLPTVAKQPKVLEDGEKKSKPNRPQKRGLSEPVVEDEISPPTISQEKRSRVKKISTCSTASESKNSEPKLPLTVEPLPNVPRNDAAVVLCGICNKEVEIGYVARKDHVSKKHLGSNHSEEDYVSLLETTMKRAFCDLSYSDIQCQQCQKTVRISRRHHVYETHVLKRIDCPIEDCTFSALTVVKVTKHLKKDHNLAKGYRSIENPQLRADYEQISKEHTNYVEALVERCFPCTIPNCYQYPEAKKSSTSQPQLLSGLKERFCQENPRTMPLRRLSESSDSNESCSNLSIIEIHHKGSDDSEPINEEFVETERRGNDTPLEFAVDEVKSVCTDGINPTCHVGAEETSQVETDNSKEVSDTQATIRQFTETVPKKPCIVKTEVQPEVDIDNSYNNAIQEEVPSRFNQQEPRRFEARWDQPYEKLNSSGSRSSYFFFNHNRTDEPRGYTPTRRPETQDDRYTSRRSPRRHASDHRDHSDRRYSSSNHHPSSRHDVPSRRSYDTNVYVRDSYRDRWSSPSTSRHNDSSSRFGGASRPLYSMRSSDR